MLLSIVMKDSFDQTDFHEFAQVASLNMSWHEFLSGQPSTCGDPSAVGRGAGARQFGAEAMEPRSSAYIYLAGHRYNLRS